jgi:hypothetical protein
VLFRTLDHVVGAENQRIRIGGGSGTKIFEYPGRDKMTVLEFSILETEFANAGWHRVLKRLLLRNSEGIVGTGLNQTVQLESHSRCSERVG